ncbi:hypothetical protein ACOI1C_00035 [Bacillus sp. DJP31]|uniref:hypothetical protein n=1 Tax=Bacillus sp. DJP31 TaxID=3409789 RepID=UPI003BB55384
MISHDFGLDLAAYKEIEKIFECLGCGGKGLLHRHDFYTRYVITEDGTTYIILSNTQLILE